MNKDIPKLIKGGSFKDERGKVNFVNDFLMSQVKRLYYTEHFSTDVIRAWQAHIIEKRWFLCVEGGFTVKLVALDDFENPSDELPVYEFELDADTPEVIYIPEGYANGFQATKDNSKLMIFSDYNFEDNPNDQIRFDKNKWTKWNNELK